MHIPWVFVEQQCSGPAGKGVFGLGLQERLWRRGGNCGSRKALSSDSQHRHLSLAASFFPVITKPPRSISLCQVLSCLPEAPPSAPCGPTDFPSPFPWLPGGSHAPHLMSPLFLHWGQPFTDTNASCRHLCPTTSTTRSTPWPLSCAVLSWICILHRVPTSTLLL